MIGILGQFLDTIGPIQFGRMCKPFTLRNYHVCYEMSPRV